MEKYTFHEQVVNLKKFIDDTEMTSPERKLMINGMVTSLEVRYELDLPSVQPDIVRCKDCRHYQYYTDKGYCMLGRWWLEDDYCSRGERRDDR